MRTVTINSTYCVLLRPEQITEETLYKYDHIAIEFDDGTISPLARNSFEPGVLYVPGEIMHTITPVEYTVGNIMTFPVDDGIDIKDILKENEESRDLIYEQISTSTADNVFHPVITGNETAEMKILKDAIEAKGIDINKYESRFNGKFQNDKRLLNKDTISLDKLKGIAEALDMEVEMSIRDKDESVINPMNEEFTAIITEEDEV